MCSRNAASQGQERYCGLGLRIRIQIFGFKVWSLGLGAWDLRLGCYWDLDIALSDVGFHASSRPSSG